MAYKKTVEILQKRIYMSATTEHDSKNHDWRNKIN